MLPDADARRHARCLTTITGKEREGGKEPWLQIVHLNITQPMGISLFPACHSQSRRCTSLFSVFTDCNLRRNINNFLLSYDAAQYQYQCT